MKVAVIGAGIVGVTTAFELAVDGHDVTVFERRAAVAEESSFANAGVVAPGYVTPWAAPGMPGKIAGYLLRQHAPVRLTLPLSREHIAWMWQWFQACEPATYAANRARMQRLAFYSRTRLNDITTHFQFEYDRSSGYMVLLRGAKDLQAGAAQPAGAARPWRRLQGNQRRRSSDHRAGHQSGHGVRGRRAPAGRRGRQLPAIRPAVEGRGAARGRALRVQSCRRSAGRGPSGLC